MIKKIRALYYDCIRSLKNLDSAKELTKVNSHEALILIGRFYLKRKKCLIDNIEPTEEYLKDREGTAQSILGGDDMSNYTNELKKDLSLIDKSRLKTPRILIKFGKERKNQYLVWDNNKITRYKGQPVKVVYSMRPYLDSVYSPDRKQTIIDIFDAKGFKFDSLITLSYFQEEMQQIRK